MPNSKRSKRAAPPDCAALKQAVLDASNAFVAATAQLNAAEENYNAALQALQAAQAALDASGCP